MLDPGYIDEAGDLVAAVYSQIEAELLDYLVTLLLSGGNLDQMGYTALALLVQTHAPELRRIIDDHADEVDEAVRATVVDALSRSDMDDMARIGEPGQEPLWPRQVDATAVGIAAILARDNLLMEQAAKDLFIRKSVEAVTAVNAGVTTIDKAMRKAVRGMEREGLSWIQYGRDGRPTVRNRADVAVRRHVRTQIAQDGARMTLQRMERMDVALVETSSHSDSRPEHEPWQGRVFSLHGDVTIDGRRYKDFYRETGYGRVDGLMGANCRHSFGPYIHGTKRAYDPDPEHPSGLDGPEVYALEQEQRACERSIRQAKRELAGAQILYDADQSLENLAALGLARDKLARRQKKMRDLIADANARSVTGAPVLFRKPKREWAGDMPKIFAVHGRSIKVDEFLSMGANVRNRENLGFTASEVSQAFRDQLRMNGISAGSFKYLPAREQKSLYDEAIRGLSRTRYETVSRARRAAERVNPGYKPGSAETSKNCQRCVTAYEALMRGMNVVAEELHTDLYIDYLANHPLAPYRNAEWVFIGHPDPSAIESQMREWGDGSRAIVEVTYRGLDEDGRAHGHVFSAIQIGDTTFLVDPQNPKRNPASLLNPEMVESNVRIARIDDKEFTSWASKCYKNVD